MSRRRARRPDLALQSEPKIDIPIQEKSVHKRVPAVVHWAQVAGTDREDDEVIGTAIIYDDGTSDVLINADISPEAKTLVGVINSNLDNYTIED